MFRSVVGGAALALCLAASPAAAEPFQSFLKACVATDGDAASAIAAVGDIGWKPLPAEAFPEKADEEVRNLTMHLNFDPEGAELPESMEMLMTGQADGAMVLDAPGIMMDICGVLAPDGDAEHLIRQVAAHFGGSPQMTEDAFTAWAYSRQDDRIVLEADLMDAEDAEILEALRQRPLFAIYVVREDDMAGVMLGAFRSTKGADH